MEVAAHVKESVADEMDSGCPKDSAFRQPQLEVSSGKMSAQTSIALVEQNPPDPVPAQGWGRGWGSQLVPVTATSCCCGLHLQASAHEPCRASPGLGVYP